MNKGDRNSFNVGIEGRALLVEHFSGIGHYLAGILHGLETQQRIEDNDDEYSLIIPFKSRKGAPHFKTAGFEYEYIPIPGRVYNRLSSKGMLPPLDLLLGKKLYFFPNYLSWPLAFSPSVVMIYDIVFKTHPEFVEPQNLRYLNNLMPGLIKNATKIVTISENSKKELIEHYDLPSEKIAIVTPAVDRALFYRRSNKEIAKIKSKYGIKGKYLLYIGNIEPRKNLVTLLDAFSKLPKNIIREYTLVLIGSGGWLNENISERIGQLDKKGVNIVHPEKFVPDEEIPALYSGAEVFVFPSLYEGFGMPVLESMTCGTPVICSDNSSLPEVAEDAALMINANDINSLVDAMTEVIDNPKLKKDMISKGYLVSKKYSWRKSAQKLIDIFSQVNEDWKSN